ncbi:MAG: acyl-CoA thioesterase [Myxococcales bacterium]|nr:acyl-CoA thioesterase [Myxococcales bacterium]
MTEQDAHPLVPFRHRQTARFFEIDRAGIVFFGRFYEYAHAAFEELLTAALGHSEAMFKELGFGMPLVHSEADYKAPVLMGDRLLIEVEVERLGEKSVTFRYTISGEADGKLRAVVRLVHAFVDLATFRPIPVAPALLDGLVRLHLCQGPAEAVSPAP